MQLSKSGEMYYMKVLHATSKSRDKKVSGETTEERNWCPLSQLQCIAIFKLVVLFFFICRWEQYLSDF